MAKVDGSIFERVAMIPLGKAIPKPRSSRTYTLKKIGYMYGEPAIAYSIPRTNGQNGSKWLTKSQIDRAYQELCRGGEITRDYWQQHIALRPDEGGCNFTSFGGLLMILGEAEWVGKGTYRRRSHE